MTGHEAPQRLLRAVLAAAVFAGMMEAAGYSVFYFRHREFPHRFAGERFHNAYEAHYVTDHPYLPYLAREGVWKQIRFNSLGDRGGEPEMPKKRIRVICFGGSTTFDAVHDDEHTWPGILQKSLGTGRYEVINAAQNGATTADTLVNLALLHSDLQPDFILVLDGINDLESSYAVGFRPDYAHRRRKIPDVPYPIFARLPRWLEYSSVFVETQAALLGDRGDLHWLYTRPTAYRFDFERGPFGLDTFRRNLMHIRAICREHKAKLVLGTPPYYRLLAERQRSLGKDFPGAWQRGIDAENAIIRDVASKTPNVFLAEVAESFSPTELEMLDFCHFTEKGNERVAESFYKAIKAAER
jgi:lysophospholipase L1-like esterase